MKRKILFIISNFETGGVSKAMTSLLNVIDREQYDVSVMIVSPCGALMKLLPSDINIITNPVWSALAGRLNGAKQLISLGKPFIALAHILRLMVSMFSKAKAGELIARLMPGLDEEFDTVVDFNGQQQLYYMIDKIRACKKVTFFHSDYHRWPYYYSADKKYFPKADYIFTISEECVKSLKEVFPSESDKIGLMENISSLEFIERMAAEPISDMKRNVPSLITIGHVCDNKGSHWAIEAASMLKKKGIDFNWYFLGSNPDCDRYDAMCRDNDVSDRMHYIGIRVNPYPYIKQADIVVHPSKFEGKSIALDEAKLLCKPVVVTNFSTVHDQFTNGKNSLICEMNPKDIADKIERLLSDQDMRNSFIKTLKDERKDNSDEIKKLYQIFDK